MMSSASEMSEDPSAIHEVEINPEYKDYSTPSYDSQRDVRPRKQAVDTARMNLISKIKDFINDIIYNREIVDFQITTFDSNINELQTMMSKPDIVSYYSYKSNGHIISGKDFMISTSKKILEVIKVFFNELTNVVSETTNPILLQIALKLVHFTSQVLTLYEPVNVSNILKQFKNQLQKMDIRNAEYAALNRAADLAAEIRMNRRIERSRLHYEALNARESEMLTKRLNRSNHGGKSMKPKQHRNSKTQKKRQRKNQKK
jgi:hypothetical protein